VLINDMHRGLPEEAREEKPEEAREAGWSFTERQSPGSFAARQAALSRMGRVADSLDQSRARLERSRERLSHPLHPLFLLESPAPRLAEPLETVERFPPGPPMRRLSDDLPDDLPVIPSGVSSTSTLENTNVDLARMLQTIGVSSDDFAQALWNQESVVLGRVNANDDGEDDTRGEGSSEDDIFAPVESLRDPHALDDIFDPPSAEEQQRQLALTNARIQEELREAREALRVAAQMVEHNEQEALGYQRALWVLGLFWLFVFGLSVCSLCLSIAAL